MDSRVMAFQIFIGLFALKFCGIHLIGKYLSKVLLDSSKEISWDLLGRCRLSINFVFG